jgi:hypothetical protein
MNVELVPDFFVGDLGFTGEALELVPDVILPLRPLVAYVFATNPAEIPPPPIDDRIPYPFPTTPAFGLAPNDVMPVEEISVDSLTLCSSFTAPIEGSGSGTSSTPMVYFIPEAI